jgi:FixJ family two-component response regulator
MIASLAIAKELRPFPMSDVHHTVYIVDDDISVRESLELLIGEVGWKPEAFASAQEFLAHPRKDFPCCLVLDVSLPDLDGLELQKRIAADQKALPIIFITGRGDIPMSVRAMKAGAVEFLTKPFDPQALIGAIEGALKRSASARQELLDLEVLRGRYATLSGREKEVMSHVVSGRLNKQIGAMLGITEITVKAHRGQAMRKMRARSLPELVTMAANLDAETQASRRAL